MAVDGLPGRTEAPVPRSIGRVLDVLEVIVEGGPTNLTTAANHVALTPTTTLRHLRALETRGYVLRDDEGLFRAGPTLYQMAASLEPRGELDRLIPAIQPVLEDLASSTGESAYLAASDGSKASYVATAESTRAIRHVGWIGQDIPLVGTALGEAFASRGTVAIRTGAVEPDITALSLFLGDVGGMQTAISIVGPDHRFTRAAQVDAANDLMQAVLMLQEQDVVRTPVVTP